MIAFVDLAVYTLLPIAAMIIAGFVAAYRPAGPQMRSAIMHLGAGVVFAVVAIELLPTIVHSAAIVAVVIGFSAGAGLMLTLRQLLEHDDEEGESEHAESGGGSSTGMLVAIGVDLVVDGIMLGLGFAAGERAGILLAIALTIETVSLGLAIATSLRERSIPTRRIIGIIVVLAAMLVVGATAGGVGLRYAPPSVVPGMLAFGAAALLFLVTEELLEEAHEVKETPALTAMFFVGFLALMVLEMLGAAH